MIYTFEKYLFNPFVITFMMLVAFMLAVRPASAGGIPSIESSGVGGSATGISVDEPIPTIMNKETLSHNVQVEQGSSTAAVSGVVVSKDTSSLTLQTWQGQRVLSLSDDTVFKSDNTIVSANEIRRGDILSATTDSRGEMLHARKTDSLSGAMQGFIALGAASAVGAGVATNVFVKNEETIKQLPATRKYLLQ